MFTTACILGIEQGGRCPKHSSPATPPETSVNFEGVLVILVSVSESLSLICIPHRPSSKWRWRSSDIWWTTCGWATHLWLSLVDLWGAALRFFWQHNTHWEAWSWCLHLSPSGRPPDILVGASLPSCLATSSKTIGGAGWKGWKENGWGKSGRC